MQFKRMLKIDRKTQTLSRLDKLSLVDARILERTDLQEFIYSSGDEFFEEIGERIFLVGKEVVASQTVQDRIDLLGVDCEGATVIVELKRGSNKLQMFQAISYAGMVEHWDVSDFRNLVSPETWENLIDFLDVDVENINRRQRLLLISEGFDYALLSGAEWLTQHHDVEIRCISISVATDQVTDSEYLACTNIFPPPALADQATARARIRQGARPQKWISWEEALADLENESVKVFFRKQLDAGQENYLLKRGLHFRLEGKRRWTVHCRNKHAYVWQRGRFPNDIAFWQSVLGETNTLKEVKNGKALAFNLVSEKDFTAFEQVVKQGAMAGTWYETNPDELDTELQ